jgi:hypothetical protein
MKSKWVVRGLPMRETSQDQAGDAARTLAWAEIAGLIDISPDGSWRPTAFGKVQLMKLERDLASRAGATAL